MPNIKSLHQKTKSLQPRHEFVTEKQEFDLQVKVQGHGIFSATPNSPSLGQISKAHIKRQKKLQPGHKFITEKQEFDLKKIPKEQ